MKHHNNLSVLAKRVLLCITIAAVVSGCTKKFESINTDPYGLSERQLAADFGLYAAPFRQMQLGIHLYNPTWQYQLQQNLNADIYSGYMMTPSPFNSNSNNSNYFMMEGWNDFIWTLAYSQVMAPSSAAIKQAIRDTLSNFHAWALILRVLAMQRISDIYGPIIYTSYGLINKDGSVSYDSQQEAYMAFLKDLDEAQTKLEPYAADNSLPKVFKNFDMAYGGDYVKWQQLLNSLRLRIALRISKVDPAKAKGEGEKALLNKYGVIEDNASDFIIDSKTISNPINDISKSWGDIRMGAPMESYLAGYDDPRISKFFEPATDPLIVNEYKGIRNGIEINSGDTYRRHSAVASLGNKTQLLTAAEVWFLKAEAKLKGWNVPGNFTTVQSLYEEGIRHSFIQWDVAGKFEDYKNSTAKPLPYVDPINNANSVLVGSPYLSTVSPKWNGAGTNEEKLEQILTQKWIALFPESVEAWSEFRRTGYPKLFPVVLNKSGGVLSSNEFIKRIPFAVSEKTTNQAGLSGALQKLGGTDNIATRLWWDKP
ncbi:MAG: SusD/RagB family nutrient-binding outer membrane lipoprotein [Chitinophagaceae bacterium]|nr:SusD/RagB family nutrient-binding outer membrane lipoprotein [Chitinophagaceae bacterium]